MKEKLPVDTLLRRDGMVLNFMVTSGIVEGNLISFLNLIEVELT